MNYFHFCILLTFLTLTCFSQTGKDSMYTWKSNKDTTIIGKAMNAKAGAIIVDIYENTFYVDGLERWEEKYENKILKVKGKLAKKVYPGGKLPADPNEPIVQSMEGDMTVITEASWIILKQKKPVKKKEKTRSKG